MSVPPLVCSTPPPPDQVDEEGYNEEIAYNYEDSLSPTHHFEPREFSSFDSPSPQDTSVEANYVSVSMPNTFDTIKNNSNAKQECEKNADCKVHNGKEVDFPTSKETSETDSTTNESLQHNTSEENNVEDLDLKLESLNIDFENERFSVEESLNSTFDDFGTFLSTSELNETHFTTKTVDAEHSYTESEKESKSQETCSDDNVSLQNEDHSDMDTGWEDTNHNLFKVDSNNCTDKEPIPFDSGSAFHETDIFNNFPSDDTLNDLNKIITSSFPDTLDLDNSGLDADKQEILKSDYSNEDELKSDSVNESRNQEKDTSTDSLPQTSVVKLAEDISCDIQQSSIENGHNIIEDSDFTDFNTDISPDTEPNIQEKTGNTSKGTEDDDFCDFADFKNVDSKNIVSDMQFDDHTKEDNKQSSLPETNDFGDFSAFQNNSEINSKQVTENCSLEITLAVETDLNTNCEDLNSKTTEINQRDDSFSGEEDDDFGDFGTYDPTIVPVENRSTIITNATSQSSESFKINDLVNSDDSDINDILCKAVSTIYPDDKNNEEIDENNHELLNVLGESWKQLRDYEAEQSYLFMWNNSASQKSLLKSLGIDSRNILFGPKWNSNMPRFAANLGVNPLQPIKQTLTPTSTVEYRNEEKSANSSDIPNSNTQPTLSDWQDIESFSMADNQASCNERGEEHVVKSPTHETENKSDKIQPPSILNLGRKINLPDTHIFTPTDSETPWSHTIHYDDSSTNFNLKNKDFGDAVSTGSSNVEDKSNEINEEDDFEDFQSHENLEYSDQVNPENIKKKEQNVEKDLDSQISHEYISIPPSDSKSNLTVGRLNLEEFDDFGEFHSALVIEPMLQNVQVLPPVSVLEPVKISPAVPTVNWPSPGEVSTSVFDDFSEINDVQNMPTSWSKGIMDSKSPSLPFSQGYPVCPTPIILKETKIDATTCAMDNVQNSTISDDKKINDSSHFQPISRTPYEQNTVVQPNFKEPHRTQNISSSIAESTFSSNIQIFNDDFDDFQCVQYDPNYSHEKSNTVSALPTIPLQKQNTSKPESVIPLPVTWKNAPFQEYFSDYNKPVLEPIQYQRSEEAAGKSASQQILQPLSLENYSQINWPDPGTALQDLSRFNPVNSIHSYNETKEVSKATNSYANDDDGWSDFVSIKPNTLQSNYVGMPQVNSYNQPRNTFPSSQSSEDNEDWSDFVSGTVLPSRSSNEVKTISQNIHSQSSNNTTSPYYRNVNQGQFKASQPPGMSSHINAIPPLTYVSPKVNTKNYNNNNNHFQNL